MRPKLEESGCGFPGAREDVGVKDERKVKDVVFAGIDFELTIFLTKILSSGVSGWYN